MLGEQIEGIQRRGIACFEPGTFSIAELCINHHASYGIFAGAFKVSRLTAVAVTQTTDSETLNVLHENRHLSIDYQVLIKQG